VGIPLQDDAWTRPIARDAGTGGMITVGNPLGQSAA
jgi:hypothetical protein